MQGATQAALDAAKQDIDPAEMGQILGMLPARDNRLIVSARRGLSTKTGQAIGEYLAAGGQRMQSVVTALQTCPSGLMDETETALKRRAGLNQSFSLSMDERTRKMSIHA